MNYTIRLFAGIMALCVGWLFGFIQIYKPDLFRWSKNIAFVTQGVENGGAEGSLAQSPIDQVITCAMKADLVWTVLTVYTNVFKDWQVAELPADYWFYKEARLNSQDKIVTIELNGLWQGNLNINSLEHYTIHGAILDGQGVLVNCDSYEYHT